MTATLDLAVQDKRHGERQILRDIHLALDTGSIVSLVGPSGCGKSTLLAIAAGLDTHYRGRVLVDGVPVAAPRSDVGLMFQEPRLFPWLTAAQNIGFAQALDPDRVSALLDEVGLAGRGGALPHQLSGGQAQRVALARALYRQPHILLLDEPFSAVDALTRMQLQDLLGKVAAEHAVTVLLVTHDIDEALYLSDRIVLLDNAMWAYDVPASRPRPRAALAASPLKALILDRLGATPPARVVRSGEFA